MSEDQHRPPTVRVLMAVPQYPPPVVGGLERQAQELSRALAGQGVQVTVLSGEVEPGQARQAQESGVSIFRFPWPSHPMLRMIQMPLCLLWHMVTKRSRFDVVHVHNITWFGAFVILFAKLLGRPVLCKLPSVGAFGIPGMMRRRLGRLWLSIFRRADAIVAMAHQSVQELREVGYPEARILKITNGIVADRFSCDRSGVPAGDSIDDSMKVLFVGRLSPEKGLPDLLSVWPRVVAEVGRKVTLEICGRGPQEEELRHMVRELGQSETVYFRGHVSDMPAVLQSADLFVLPSYEEGNSNAILEAMAAALPIVSTRVGGTALLVGPVAQEYIVEPGDREGLARCLLALLRQEETRRTLSEQMERRVRSLFAMNVVAARYSEAYQLLAQGRRDEIIYLASPIFSAGG